MDLIKYRLWFMVYGSRKIFKAFRLIGTSYKVNSCKADISTYTCIGRASVKSDSIEIEILSSLCSSKQYWFSIDSVCKAIFVSLNKWMHWIRPSVFLILCPFVSQPELFSFVAYSRLIEWNRLSLATFTFRLLPLPLPLHPIWFGIRSFQFCLCFLLPNFHFSTQYSVFG